MDAKPCKPAEWLAVVALALTAVLPVFPRPSSAQENTATLPPVDGACCTPDGLCYDFTPESCASNGGDYQGDGTVCDVGVCPGIVDGACCTPDGLCYDFVPSSCAANGGVYQGDGTVCDIGVCPPITTTTLAGPICGDADMDGEIKAGDALIALRTAVGSGTCAVERCDYDGSGTVTATDALAILKAAVGLPPVAKCPSV